MTFGVDGDTTLAGIFTGLSATNRVDAGAFINAVHTWVPFFGTIGQYTLRATHGRFNPALVTANESAIFSTESETYFDAVTRRSNGQLRFIWNWYY